MKLNRRAFLGLGAAACAGSVLRAASAHTSWKSGRERPILGNGEHRYECVHDWLTPPEGLAWGDTHGLAQDEAGRIYVAHTVHPSSSKGEGVVVFGENGTFETAWGSAFRGGAHGLDVRSEQHGEYLYHCDTARRLVVKTDLKGETVWEAGWPEKSGKYESKERFCPTNVAFGTRGLIVGDGYGSSYIHQYDYLTGKYLRTLAGPGKEAGQVSCPHGLWMESRGRVTPAGIVNWAAGEEQKAALAVADRGNRRIQYFTEEGEHICFVKTGVRQPCHFKMRDDLMLVPDLDSVVTLLGKDFKPVAHLGDGAQEGKPSSLRGAARKDFVTGKFIHPHTAIFLRNGDILVAEWVPIGRVTLLRKV